MPNIMFNIFFVYDSHTSRVGNSQILSDPGIFVALVFPTILSPVTSRSHCTFCDLSALMAWENTSKFIAGQNSSKRTEPYRQTMDILHLPAVILLHFVTIFPVNLLHNCYISLLFLLVRIDNPFVRS